MKTADLHAEIKKQLETLAADSSAARQAEQWKTFVRFAATFHNYSMGNVMLIAFQRPNATQVAGFHDWLKKHRYVKKGEHGIAILAPCPYARTNEQGEREQKVYFKVAYVFDVTQAEGEELPTPPDWKDTARRLELENRLVMYAESIGLSVDRVQSLDGAAGRASKKGIQIAEDAGTVTLIHEIAHAVLGHMDKHDTPRAVREIQAESVAAIVGARYDLPTDTSANYLANWGKDAESIKCELAAVTRAASQIIQAIEKESMPEEENTPTPERVNTYTVDLAKAEFENAVETANTEDAGAL